MKNVKFINKNKRYIYLLISFLCLFVLNGCDDTDEFKSNDDVSQIGSIKIICFGNSFTHDCMSYVPCIMNDVVPQLDVTIGIAYMGGCSLVQHYANFIGKTIKFDSREYFPTKYTYYEYSTDVGKWKTIGKYHADRILLDEDWDVVTFQQNGSNSDSKWEKYYEPYIYPIHESVRELVGDSIKLGWLSVHGAYKTTFDGLFAKWKGTIENTKKIDELTDNEIVFPFGTAVQNLRTTPLVNLGDGGFLMADNGHLHEGIGCLTAAYAIVLKILEFAGLENEVTILGNDIRPTKEWCKKIGVPGANFGPKTNDVVGISDENCYTAQMAAIMAVKYPYEVTDCNAYYIEP